MFVVCVDHIYHRIVTSVDHQKGVWTALYVSLRSFPYALCATWCFFQISHQIFPQSFEKTVDPECLTDTVSQLWCSDVFAQMQFIEQTGSLGIRWEVGKKKRKKKKITAAVGRCCLSAVSFLLSHMQRSLEHCFILQGLDSKICFLYLPFIPKVERYLISERRRQKRLLFSHVNLQLLLDQGTVTSLFYCPVTVPTQPSLLLPDQSKLLILCCSLGLGSEGLEPAGLQDCLSTRCTVIGWDRSGVLLLVNTGFYELCIESGVGFTSVY